MAKKKTVKPVSRKPVDDVCRVTGRMPEWMQEYLADQGIEAQFSLSNLTKEQFFALELAERLLQKEMNGLIRVTYDPQKNPEPQAELTDSAKNEYCKKPSETDEETTGKPTQETCDGKFEAGDDAEWSNSDTA